MTVETSGALTVVIPTRDRPAFLGNCLESVKASVGETDEVIVVDSASSDGTVRDVAQNHGVTYLRCDEPGASLARNVGWKNAKHELIAFIDDDVLVYPKWADAMRSAFARFPEAQFVSGRVEPSNGIPSDGATPWLLFDDPAWVDREYLEDPGHSANLAVRGSALRQLGGFDELLGAGGKFRAAEDKDLFDRLVCAGMLGRYEPEASVVHLDWRDRSDALRLNWNYGFGSGARLMKQLKIDRARARRIAGETIWQWGIRAIYLQLKRRYKWLVLVATVRTLGMIYGFLRAAPYRVLDGHLRSRFGRR